MERRNIGIGHIEDTEIAGEDGSLHHSHGLHSDDRTLDRYLFTRKSKLQLKRKNPEWFKVAALHVEILILQMID